MSTEIQHLQSQLNELQETIRQLKIKNDSLEKLAQHADAANKAKSDFLAMISHEIRTPMNGVIGLTELLLDTKLKAKQKHYSSLILTSARNLLTLINSLLDFSKIEAEMMELDIAVFNLKQLVSELMTLYNVASEHKNVEVFAEIDPRVADTYLGDSYRIRQILVNLLGNGIKFTDKGSVILRIKYVESADKSKDLLRFEVCDTGPGIPSDKLDRLFKPFTQVDASSTRRHSGTGLGLSICQKLVELMKGKIGVSSEIGKGSIFWFSIPLQPGEGSMEKEKSGSITGKDIHIVRSEPLPEEENLSASAPFVMVVDDDETNRFVLQTVLLKAGAEVIVARNGEDAIEQFRNNEPDLIFMDCQMPVLDGFEASKKIHAIAKELQRKKPSIIALTADATQSTKQHCKEVGMDDYLTKPLEFGKLQSTLDNWLPGSGLQIVSHRQAIEVAEGADYHDDKDFIGEQIDPQALVRLKQNMGDITPVIRVFLNSLPIRLEELNNAIHHDDHESIRRVAHTLKGSSSQFGARYLSSLCFHAENMAKKGHLETIDAVYEKICTASEAIADFLQEQLDKA